MISEAIKQQEEETSRSPKGGECKVLPRNWNGATTSSPPRGGEGKAPLHRGQSLRLCRGPYQKPRSPSLRHKQTFRKGPLGIDPLRIAAEAGIFGHAGNFRQGILVATLSPNGFAFQQ